jgi:glycosyltransferase involved in cell wall biosynthesis
MRTHPASIYHVLYGENHFRYLPKLTSLRKHKVVCTFHATPDEFKRMMQSTEHLKTIDAAIVVSNIQRPLFDSILGSEKVFFIPLGVDVEYFVPPHSGKKDSTKVCLCVGHHHRDFSTLCKVAAILKNWDPEVRFIVINKVFSAYLTPEQQEFYKKSFAELGNVELLESVADEELLRFYQTSDLMVLPLLDTTANIALLEALSCGLPVVTTDIGGVRDYVDPDIAAFVPPQNAEIMADQIMRLLQNPLGREKLSHASRKKAMSFDWKVVAEQVRQLYNQIAQD